MSALAMDYPGRRSGARNNHSRNRANSIVNDEPANHFLQYDHVVHPQRRTRQVQGDHQGDHYVLSVARHSLISSPSWTDDIVTISHLHTTTACACTHARLIALHRSLIGHALSALRVSVLHPGDDLLSSTNRRACQSHRVQRLTMMSCDVNKQTL